MDEQELKIELVGDKEIDICKGQTILEASLNSGIPHFHACGGNAECSTCRILVLEGMENLSPINEDEKELRESMNLPHNIRLACQTRVVKTPVRVRRIILEETDIPVYIRDELHSAVNNQLGEKRELVLFFLDIRNFTPFVESHLPFDVIHVMRAVHTIFNTIIKKNNGVIIDTAGDGFYAVFGLDRSINVAADQAMEAGRTILRELSRFNETYLEPLFSAQLEIGIGLHCGEVIVGEVMVGQKSHLSVMGFAVNVASRLQGSTKKLDNSFIISDDVMRKATRQMKGKKRMIRLRGVSGVFQVHLVGNGYKTAPIISGNLG